MDRKALVERVDDLETRVAVLDQDWQTLPDFIDARLRVTDGRIGRLAADIETLQRDLAGMLRLLRRIDLGRRMARETDVDSDEASPEGAS